MKRFKDNNSQNIVTSQNVFQRIQGKTLQTLRFINELRTLKNVTSLGEVELSGSPGVMVPVMPKVKENWSTIVEILSGVKQEDEKKVINLAYKLGGFGAALQVAEFIGKLPIQKTGFSYIGLHIMIGQGISWGIAQLKGGARAKFMQAGGQGIYDNIKNIMQKKYTFKRYKIDVSQGTVTYVPDVDKSMTLAEAAERMKGGLEDDGASFRHDGYLYHLKNQADADEINQMIEQLLKDEKADTLLSKYLPVAGVGTAWLGGGLYFRGSDPKNKNPNPKQRKTDAFGQPLSTTVSTPQQREIAQEETFKKLGIPVPKGNK